MSDEQVLSTAIPTDTVIDSDPSPMGGETSDDLLLTDENEEDHMLPITTSSSPSSPIFVNEDMVYHTDGMEDVELSADLNISNRPNALKLKANVSAALFNKLCGSTRRIVPYVAMPLLILIAALWQHWRIVPCVAMPLLILIAVVSIIFLHSVGKSNDNSAQSNSAPPGSIPALPTSIPVVYKAPNPSSTYQKAPRTNTKQPTRAPTKPQHVKRTPLPTLDMETDVEYIPGHELFTTLFPQPSPQSSPTSAPASASITTAASPSTTTAASPSATTAKPTTNALTSGNSVFITIRNSGLTQSKTLLDTDTLQHKAYKFVSHPPQSSKSPPADKDLLQRYVLTILFLMRGYIDQNTLSEEMNLNADACDWNPKIIKCNKDDKSEDFGRVMYLDLGKQFMVGSIPSEIGYLTNLVDLALNNNQLVEKLPSTLGLLTKLTQLDISVNANINGQIPTELGSLTSLTELYLWKNNLVGTIPTEFGKLNKMEYLYIDENLLTGTIPTELGRLTALDWLYLGWNNLKGRIPTEIGRMTSLTVFSVDECHTLDSTIPTELALATDMYYLILNGNSFTGTIPSELAAFGTSLDRLYLQGNQLSGTIPSELGMLSELQVLTIEENNLTGTIPTTLGRLSVLQTLTMYKNQLTGTIPSELVGSSDSLETLELHNNQLEGSIPDIFISFYNLTTFYIDYNDITGSIEFMCPLGIEW
eukprot:CAMPEP_0194447102 /NCGR_PEP_ID=MMETSP0176-20130528/128821_1 /TAXON_ID=216777 /ORGANISM="Proboscia alata, Strain PI-D3" /LENGTH=702 /DNA_ID=CAMNT_0039273917 /DNA_START=78 /DNA_END=2184 /DNA_ORIENTATION=+